MLPTLCAGREWLFLKAFRSTKCLWHLGLAPEGVLDLEGLNLMKSCKKFSALDQMFSLTLEDRVDTNQKGTLSASLASLKASAVGSLLQQFLVAPARGRPLVSDLPGICYFTRCEAGLFIYLLGCV